MGSGSVGVAALRSGRRFIGTDVNIEAVRMTAKRLREFGVGQEPAELSAEAEFELVPLSPRP